MSNPYFSRIDPTRLLLDPRWFRLLIGHITMDGRTIAAMHRKRGYEYTFLRTREAYIVLHLQIAYRYY